MFGKFFKINKMAGKIIELKAHEVTDKEQQIITRKRTGKMFLDDLVRQVKQGNVPATFVALQLKQFMKEFNTCLSKIDEQAKEELVGTEHYIYGDHKLIFRQGSKTVDYSEVDEVVLMETHLKQLKSKYKAALDGVEKGNTVVQPDHCFVDSDGEIKKLPKWKYNKSSINLTKV